MGFTHEGIPFSLTIGRELSVCNNLSQHFKSAYQQHLDFITTPLFHPHLDRDKNSIVTEIDPLAKPDTLVDSQRWTRNIIGVLSKDINLDSPYVHITKKSKFYLKQELNYAIHLGVSGFIIPKCSSKADTYARTINKFLLRGTGNTQLWMKMSLSDEDSNNWDIYNAFRLKLENSRSFGVCLEIGEDLPDQNIIKRWMAEEVKAFILRSDIFITDEAGNPMLSKKHAQLIQQSFALRPLIIIKPQTNTENIEKYRNYIVNLFTTQPPIHEIECIQYRFNDVLQQPLQPLRDNLESQLYAHFEKDEVKYEYYERAIYMALKEQLLDRERIVIMVIGAGRAPLVKVCFKAASELNRKVFVYAIEKNPNAIITINSYFAQNRSELKDKFAVVCKDIRDWDPPEKADILFSELLGSFSDNELSPEILDWSQRLLKPGGLNVPYEYSSFLTPISYPYIHNQLKNSSNSEKQLEIPHVVKLQRYYTPCGVQKCFTFNHPRTKEQKDNKRSQSLEFRFNETNTIHGFAGYFEGNLYPGVCISINPETITPNLYSWFPIYFPFEKPLLVNQDSILRINVWRHASGRRIWYEWQAEVCSSATSTMLNYTKIHNANGRSYSIDL